MKKSTTHTRNHSVGIREDNKLALYCYFRNNAAKEALGKEIWTEFGRFKATNQKLDDQFMTITKIGCFFWPWNTRHPPTNLKANTATKPNHKYIDKHIDKPLPQKPRQ